MHRNLPPFPAVRAFEASARHCSFKLAAEELCLTPSAISHQVKTLEDYLGVQLFFRETRGVVLTSEGAGYLQELAGILDRMAAATAHVRSSDASGLLSVRTSPGFANRWLVPRLATFQEIHPAIELNISTSVRPADFAKEDVDVDIRWGCEPSPGMRVDPLIAATRFPVASPALLKNGPVLHRPDDLRHYTLLHDISGNDWERWFKLAGASFEPPGAHVLPTAICCSLQQPKDRVWPWPSIFWSRAIWPMAAWSGCSKRTCRPRSSTQW